jgi:hypothetical protein
MKNNRFGFAQLAAASAAACSLIACQDLADAHTSPPVLARIRGTLSLAGDMPAPEGDIRLAVLWKTEYGDMPPDRNASEPNYPCAVDPSKLPADSDQWGGYADASDVGYQRFRSAFAEQQVEIQTEFPVQFRLDISEPPPPGTLDVPLQDHFNPGLMAEGQFVVYRDVNRNGTLDPSTFGHPSMDEILSVSAGPQPPTPKAVYEIQYVERKPVFDETAARAAFRDFPGLDEAGLQEYGHQYDYLRPGYNLVRSNPQTLSPERLSNHTTVALVLDANAGWQRVLCEDSCWKPDDYQCPADPADLPERDSRSRDVYRDELSSGWYYSDGATQFEGLESCGVLESGARSYEYDRFECNGCVCKLIRCKYQADELPAGVELPCGDPSHS